MRVRCDVSPGSRMSGQRTGPPLLAAEVITALLLGTLAARVHHGLILAAACRLTLCGVPLAFIYAEYIGCRMVLTGSAFHWYHAAPYPHDCGQRQWQVLARAVIGVSPYPASIWC